LFVAHLSYTIVGKDIYIMIVIKIIITALLFSVKSLSFLFVFVKGEHGAFFMILSNNISIRITFHVYLIVLFY